MIKHEGYKAEHKCTSSWEDNKVTSEIEIRNTQRSTSENRLERQTNTYETNQGLEVECSILRLKIITAGTTMKGSYKSIDTL